MGRHALLGPDSNSVGEMSSENPVLLKPRAEPRIEENERTH